MQATAETTTWYVVCLCAQWCSTCRAYAPDFLAQSGLEQADPVERYLWVDVEAHDDLLGDWDIETFPTLLIAQGDQPVFMGVLPPQIAVLARLVQSYKNEGAAPVGVNAAVAALWQQLRPRLADAK